jgi:hypothetical protein
MSPARPVHQRQSPLTALRCYYAHQHLRRPPSHCGEVPIVAYGSIVLCAACDKRRSAVGKGMTPRPVPGAALARLDQAASASREADSILTDAALATRRAGASWAQIGQAAGITRQAAQQRWGTPHHAHPPSSN